MRSWDGWIWHGTADRNVPLPVARDLFGRLPSAVLHVREGEGHAVGVVVRCEVMERVVLSAGR
ncbi:fermentation-respiration switch protein FrsA (DUF1100 family) [Crossiella equi]|uniref:Fermentation-respiration switch protein FrsA (DUF1100 family) n=1 Tax=Crossiella equi TaxID=130796 RepID=A0ABS5A684_9PSEU|nr:fermentation-respiration switch protein FrsA (DUF1100 family) [Crossiella equi]